MPLLDKLEAKESQLTALHGQLPKGSLVNGKIAGKPINDSTNEGRYQDYIVNTTRTTDRTGEETILDRTQGPR